MPAPPRTAPPTCRAPRRPCSCAGRPPRPTTPRRYLSSRRARPRPAAAATSARPAGDLDRSGRRVSPMSTSSTRPACSRRVEQQGRLEHAERHGDVRGHRRRRHLAGVRVDAARQVDGDDAGVAARPGPAGAAASAQPAAGRRCRGSRPRRRRARPGTSESAGGRHRPRATRPGPARAPGRGQQDRVHPGAAPGQRGAGAQRVAAVVAAADEQRDAEPYTPVRAAAAQHRRQPGRGTLPSACPRAARRSGRFSAARTSSTS